MKSKNEEEISIVTDPEYERLKEMSDLPGDELAQAVATNTFREFVEKELAKLPDEELAKLIRKLINMTQEEAAEVVPKLPEEEAEKVAEWFEANNERLEAERKRITAECKSLQAELRFVVGRIEAENKQHKNKSKHKNKRHKK